VHLRVLERVVLWPLIERATCSPMPAVFIIQLRVRRMPRSESVNGKPIAVEASSKDLVKTWLWRGSPFSFGKR
jgi:hypothetical protein